VGWPRTLSELFARLAARDRRALPTPAPGVPPHDPTRRDTLTHLTCRYCGLAIARDDYARHVLWHQDKGDRVAPL
jgi:hypothetical protein